MEKAQKSGCHTYSKLSSPFLPHKQKIRRFSACSAQLCSTLDETHVLFLFSMDIAQTWIFKASVSLRYFFETPLGSCLVGNILETCNSAPASCAAYYYMYYRASPPSCEGGRKRPKSRPAVADHPATAIGASQSHQELLAEGYSSTILAIHVGFPQRWGTISQ